MAANQRTQTTTPAPAPQPQTGALQPQGEQKPNISTVRLPFTASRTSAR